VAYVLPMAALELRYPVTFLILVVSRDSSLHNVLIALILRRLQIRDACTYPICWLAL